MIHTFQALGCLIAMDVDSGAVHVLDKMSYDLLNCMTPPVAEHCTDEIAARYRSTPERNWRSAGRRFVRWLSRNCFLKKRTISIPSGRW